MEKLSKSRAFRIWELEHLFYGILRDEEYHAATVDAEALLLKGLLHDGEYCQMILLANDALLLCTDDSPFPDGEQ